MTNASNDSDMSPSWQRFAAEIDMYKFHLDTSIKVAPFIFGITGAMLSYFFSGKPTAPLALSLLLPIVLNTGFGLVYGLGVTAANAMEQKHQKTAGRLDVEPFDMRPLAGVCRTLCCMCLLTALGLGIVVCVYVA